MDPCSFTKNENKDEKLEKIKTERIKIIIEQIKKYRLKKTFQPTIESINLRIKKEICYETLNLLSDENLMSEFMNCDSVRNEIKKLETILINHVNNEKKQIIIEQYLPNLIPAGTKGIIRGKKFNLIVKKVITNLKLDKKRFEIHFEKNCLIHITNEIPDWYVLDKSTDRIIIGMNQMDFWKGGHQLNRGSKYIMENDKYNNKNSKFLCVICNEIQFRSKNKIYRLFEIGFKNNTLCYINNLESIIKSFFLLQ